MPFQKCSNHQKGLTLIELMVTIAILAIIAGIAMPNFQASIAKKHIELAANGLYQAAKLARSTAINSGRHTYVCRSKYAEQSTCSAGEELEWAAGLLVYSIPTQQANRANKKYNSSSDQLIKTIRLLHKSDRENINFTAENHAGNDPIGFTPQGLLMYSDKDNLKFTFCQKDKVGEKPVYFRVSASGKISQNKNTATSQLCG